MRKQARIALGSCHRKVSVCSKQSTQLFGNPTHQDFTQKKKKNPPTKKIKWQLLTGPRLLLWCLEIPLISKISKFRRPSTNVKLDLKIFSKLQVKERLTKR